MRRRLKLLLPLGLLWGIALGGTVQSAFARPNRRPVEGLLADIEKVSTEVQSINANYEQRRGLIGKKQAEERFEKALFYYLMGKYKKAAPEFFILLDTESLDGYDFKKEAEWYLVDSAFRLGQYSIVEDSCYQIIEQGPGHLFYTDAVRTLLESYGIRNRPDKFQEAMERFVLSGLVESSGSLNYSIGKALFWQQENARAKASLMDVMPETSLYYKAQYFLGGILASEGSYQDALSAFKAALNPEPKNDLERELNDLAYLALARTHYERKEFTEAVQYYQRVGAKSPYFVDRLYEMAWSFIGMERWEDAIGVIEIFLVAYPEDGNTIRFQNTLGDLYMKLQEYEKALMTYEKVSEQLVPVQERLNEILKQEEIVKELLEARISDEYLEYGLPDYAQDMLLKNATLEQAAGLVSLSREQSQDVRQAQDYAEEIEAVLSNEENGLYIFSKDRHNLRQSELSVLDTLLRSLVAEVELLTDSASGDDKDKLGQIRADIDAVRKEFDERFVLNQSLEQRRSQYVGDVNRMQGDAESLLAVVQDLQKEVLYFRDENAKAIAALPEEEAAFIDKTLSELGVELKENIVRLEEITSEKTKTILLNNISEDSLNEYAVVIRDVQGDARAVLNINKNLRGEIEYFPDQYAEALKGVSPEERERIKKSLSDIKRELERDASKLEKIGSSKTRKELFAKMPKSSPERTMQNQLLELQRLHNRLLPFWSKGDASADAKDKVEQIWSEARTTLSSVSGIYASIDTVERQQKKIITRMLNEQKGDLASFSDDVMALAVRSEEVGTEAAMMSFQVLDQHIEDRMLGSDLGIVKVYWIRKTDLEIEKKRLIAEKLAKTNEINNRFDLIKSKLSSE